MEKQVKTAIKFLKNNLNPKYETLIIFKHYLPKITWNNKYTVLSVSFYCDFYLTVSHFYLDLCIGQ